MILISLTDIFIQKNIDSIVTLVLVLYEHEYNMNLSPKNFIGVDIYTNHFEVLLYIHDDCFLLARFFGKTF